MMIFDYSMSNDELADCIIHTNAMMNDYSPLDECYIMLFDHLKSLLAVQKARAEVARVIDT